MRKSSGKKGAASKTTPKVRKKASAKPLPQAKESSSADKSKTKAQLIDELAALRKETARIQRALDKQRVTQKALRQKDAELMATTLRLNTILDNVGACIFTKDARYRYTYANRKTLELFKCSEDQLLGKSDEAFFSAPSVEEIMKSDRPVIENGLTVTREEEDLSAPDNVPRTYLTIKLPIKDGKGRISELCGISTDITERKLVEKAFVESEKRMRDVLDNSFFGTHLYDLKPDGRLVFVGANMTADRILGVDNAQFIGKTIEEAFPPLKETDIPEAYRSVARTGESYVKEQVAYDAGGISGAFEVHAFQTGANRMAAFFHDITERRKAQEKIAQSLKEKEILLKEIHHRVKNNLAVIAALLRMQANYIKDPDDLEMFNESQGRIRAMALVHEKLYRTENLLNVNVPDYLTSLANSIKTTFAEHHNTSVTFNIEQIDLNIDVLIPCGLIINELLTNAFKHAFKERKSPAITVELRVVEGGNIRLMIADNGNGLPEGFDLEKPTGLGLQLIRALCRQIQGRLEYKTGNGTMFLLTFPREMVVSR